MANDKDTDKSDPKTPGADVPKAEKAKTEPDRSVQEITEMGRVAKIRLRDEPATDREAVLKDSIQAHAAWLRTNPATHADYAFVQQHMQSLQSLNVPGLV